MEKPLFRKWEKIAPINELLFPSIREEDKISSETFSLDTSRLIYEPILHLRVFPQTSHFQTEQTDAESEEDDIIHESELKQKIIKLRIQERFRVDLENKIECDKICIFVHREWATLRSEVQRAQELANFLKCPVLAIEYPGYGVTSQPTASARIACSTGDLVATVKTLIYYLLHRRRVPIGKIMLCGESCGAGVVSLVSQQISDLGGVMLVNAFPDLGQYLEIVTQPSKMKMEFWAKIGDFAIPGLGASKMMEWATTIIKCSYVERMPIQEIVSSLKIPFVAVVLDPLDRTFHAQESVTKLCLKFAGEINLKSNLYLEWKDDTTIREKQKIKTIIEQTFGHRDKDKNMPRRIWWRSRKEFNTLCGYNHVSEYSIQKNIKAHDEDSLWDLGGGSWVNFAFTSCCFTALYLVVFLLIFRLVIALRRKFIT
jgi:hypothetical protein